MSAPTDPLSNLARTILRDDAASAYTALVPRQTGSADAGQKLAAMSPADCFSGRIGSADDAASVLSGLWLWQDYLDESHHVSQQIQSATGSFWHAIMHRREGDFWNSKYWYARCENHPAYAVLAAQAREILDRAPANKSLLRLTLSGWQPNAFVDLVEEVHNQTNDPRHAVAVSLQQLEWRVLFDHCVRQAVMR